MEIPGLGPVEADDETYISHPVTVPVLDYNEVEFFIEGYDDDDDPEDFHDAIEAFLALDDSVLKAASQAVFAHYTDARAAFEAADPDDDADDPDDPEGPEGTDDPDLDAAPAEFVDIAGPDEVWEYVELGVEATIAREADGEQEVCVSVTCACDWDRERGLVLVFRGGRELTGVTSVDD